MTATVAKPERIYAPAQFEARDEMPEDYRRMVIRLLRETNEIGSVPVCYEQMRMMTRNVALAPDPVSRVRIVEFYCPQCGTQVDTEYLPPGHPITHDIEIDIDKLQQRIADGELHDGPVPRAAGDARPRTGPGRWPIDGAGAGPHEDPHDGHRRAQG